MKNTRRVTRELAVDLPFHAKLESEAVAVYTNDPGEHGCFVEQVGSMHVSVNFRPQQLGDAPQSQAVGQIGGWLTQPGEGRSAPIIFTLGFDVTLGNASHSPPTSLYCASFELGDEDRFKLVQLDVHPTVAPKTLELRAAELAVSVTCAIAGVDRNLNAAYDKPIDRPTNRARATKTRGVAVFPEPPDGLELQRGAHVFGRGAFSILLVVGQALASTDRQRITSLFNQLAADYHGGIVQLDVSTASSTEEEISQEEVSEEANREMNDASSTPTWKFGDAAVAILKPIVPLVDCVHFDLQGGFLLRHDF